MKFGSNFGSGFGSPENWLTYFYCEAAGEQIRVSFTPHTAGWYGVYVDSRLQTQRYVSANENVVVWVASDHNVTRQSVSVIRSGNNAYNLRRSARWYDYQTSKRVTLDWSFNYEVLGSIDNNGASKLSNWSLSGVAWYHLMPITGSRCRGYLTAPVTTSGNGHYQVTLERAGYEVATGHGLPNSEIILSGSNSSGLTGRVFITSGAIDETLYVRFPESMQVLRGTTEPPTAPVATVPFRGTPDGTWTETADKTAGQTYYYRLREVSDTGEYGTASESLAVTIPDPPAPVSSVEYVSGNAAGLALKFIPSVTAGVGLLAYCQGPDDININWNQYFSGATFDSSLNGVVLSGLSFPGSTNVWIRATKGGVEEKRGSMLAVELDSNGNYIAQRPNAPTITSITASGLGITAEVGYDPAQQEGTATHVHMYLKTPNSTYSGTPDSAANLVTDGEVYVADVTARAPSKGWYWAKIYAATAANVESVNGAEKLVFVSNNAGNTPIIDGLATRG